MNQPSPTNTRMLTPELVIRAPALLLGARLIRLGTKSYAEVGIGDLSAILPVWGFYGAGFFFLLLAVAAPIPQPWTERLGRLGTRVTKTLRASGRLQQMPRSASVVAWCGEHLRWFAYGAAVVLCAQAFAWRTKDVKYIGSDGLLFSQYAVQLLLDGKNPYSQTMEPAYTLFDVNPAAVTYRTDGSIVHELSYPALSFLLFVPQALVAGTHFSYDFTSIIALLVALILVIRISPIGLSWVPLLFVVADADIRGLARGGVFDVLWVPFVVGAAMSWSANRRFLAGALYGLACAVKQTPWLLAPFLLLWLLFDGKCWRERARTTSSFASFAALGFVVPNIAFIAMDPMRWVEGVLTPVTGQGAALVMQGVGAVAISVSGVMAVPKEFFGAAFGGGLSAAGLFYALKFDRIKWIAWYFPIAILWFNYRSLPSYFTYLSFLAYASLIFCVREMNHHALGSTSSPEDGFRPRRWLRNGFAVAFGLAFLLVVMRGFVATTSALDVRLSVPLADDPSQIGRFSRMIVEVTNDARQLIRPKFSVMHGARLTRFVWNRVDESESLEEGRTSRFVLEAPYPEAAVPYGRPAVVIVSDSKVGSERVEIVARMPPASVPSVVPIANPRFVEWTREDGAQARTPFGWTLDRRELDGGAFALEPRFDGVELVLRRPAERNVRHRMWGAKLSQGTPFPEILDVEFTAVDRVDAWDELPTRASGIELAAGATRVWIVPGSTADVQVASIKSKGVSYSVIVVPARVGERTRASVDIQALLGTRACGPLRTRSNTLSLFARLEADADDTTTAFIVHRIEQGRGRRAFSPEARSDKGDVAARFAKTSTATHP